MHSFYAKKFSMAQTFLSLYTDHNELKQGKKRVQSKRTGVKNFFLQKLLILVLYDYNINVFLKKIFSSSIKMDSFLHILAHCGILY